MAITYNTIEEALQDLRNGKCILVTDDPDRENEGDLICAGQFPHPRKTSTSWQVPQRG